MRRCDHPRSVAGNRRIANQPRARASAAPPSIGVPEQVHAGQPHEPVGTMDHLQLKAIVGPRWSREDRRGKLKPTFDWTDAHPTTDGVWLDLHHPAAQPGRGRTANNRTWSGCCTGRRLPCSRRGLNVAWERCVRHQEQSVTLSTIRWQSPCRCRSWRGSPVARRGCDCKPER